MTSATTASAAPSKSASTASKSGRISVLDVAKGLAILYVPFYHVVFTADPYMYVGEVGGCLLLGFFFLVSGYGYDPYKRPFAEQVIHRLRTLILPTFCWLAAVCVAMCGFYAIVEGENAEYLVQSILLTIFRPELMSLVSPGCETFTNMFNTMSPVWFVWTLFLADLLMYFVGKFALRGPVDTVIACVAMLCVSAMMLQADMHLPWNLQCVPFYSTLMTIGAAISKYRKENPEFQIMPGTRWIVIVIAIIGCFTISYFAPSCKLFMGGLGTLGGVNAFTFCMGSVLFTIAYVELLARLFNAVASLKLALIWLGRHTLPLLIIHGPLGVMIAHLINTPAKLETLIWSMDSEPWTQLAGAPIHWGSLEVYFLTLAASIVIIYAYDVIKGKLAK